MNKKILLIDDDDDEQYFFSEALHIIEAPVNFFFANGAENGMKIISSLNPDFIFIDMNMPLTDGITCLQNIKRNTSMRNSKVIMYSTGIDDDLCKKALQKGAWNCIKKQNSIDGLVIVLKSFLNNAGI